MCTQLTRRGAAAIGGVEREGTGDADGYRVMWNDCTGTKRRTRLFFASAGKPLRV